MTGVARKKTNEKAFNYPVAALIFAAVTVLVIIISLKLNDSSLTFPNMTAVEGGIPAPDFAYPGLDGKEVRLSHHKGKVILLNIWATWCPPCVREMPSMEKLYQRFKDDDFVILAVSIDETGLKAVAPFVTRSNLTFPVLIDSEGTIKTTYGISGIPESFIIDKQGFLVRKIVGPVDWSAAQSFRFFSELIQKPTP